MMQPVELDDGDSASDDDTGPPYKPAEHRDRGRVVEQDVSSVISTSCSSSSSRTEQHASPVQVSQNTQIVTMQGPPTASAQSSQDLQAASIAQGIEAAASVVATLFPALTQQPGSPLPALTQQAGAAPPGLMQQPGTASHIQTQAKQLAQAYQSLESGIQGMVDAVSHTSSPACQQSQSFPKIQDLAPSASSASASTSGAQSSGQQLARMSPPFQAMAPSQSSMDGPISGFRKSDAPLVNPECIQATCGVLAVMASVAGAFYVSSKLTRTQPIPHAQSPTHERHQDFDDEDDEEDDHSHREDSDDEQISEDAFEESDDEKQDVFGM